MSAWSMPSLSRTAGCEDRPMPRRSGTTTVWSFASSAAIGDHMSPVSPKPWISTTAGPWPPTRTLIIASALTTCELRKSAGKGVGAACADRAPSARLAARPAATRRKRRENVDETVADMLGSLDVNVISDAARAPRCDLLDQPRITVGVIEGEERPVARALGIRSGKPRLLGKRRTVPHLTRVDATADEFVMSRLDVRDNQPPRGRARRCRG